MSVAGPIIIVLLAAALVGFMLLRQRAAGQRDAVRRLNNELRRLLAERRAVEAEVERLRRRNELILASAGEGIYGLDAAGHCTFLNPAAERMLGWTESEVLGRSTHELFHHTRRDGTPYPAEECPVHGRVGTLAGNEGQDPDPAQADWGARQITGEVLWRRDGTSFPVEYTTVPIVEDGEVTGAVKTFHDITERERAAARVQALNRDLERRVAERTRQLAAANRELEAFAYSVSHDLRSPLRSMDGFSQALLEDYADRLDGEALDFLQRIRAASQRMASLIDDLLTLSRVSRSEMQVTRASLSELALEVVEELREAEPERDVDVVVAPDLEVAGDARLLRLALQNLLGNAWKFTRGTAGARVELGARGQDGETVYYVQDNGAGFDMQYADKLFSPFQRLHTEAEFEGTGIGLATVRRVVRRHGGRAWAEAEPGAGATIFFTLQGQSTAEESTDGRQGDPAG